jgi:alkaline phosphatase
MDVPGNVRKSLSVAAAATLAIGTVTGCETAGPPTRVIVFIADGGGTGHWSVARIARDTLTVDGFAVSGLMDTRGSDHLVTGSAPAATALATGVRSRMGAVGVGPDSVELMTVLEHARERGLSTGLVTTTRLTDATPAAFATHWPARNHFEIALQFAAQEITVLLGGGRATFTRVPDDGSPTILSRMLARYRYVESAEALDRLDLDTVPALLGLFADTDLPLAPDRQPSLATLTDAALTVLDRNPRGFFLMVENEETDTQAHHNEPYSVLKEEMLALDDAIRVAAEYRARQPNTLIIVVGDHETGGLSLVQDDDGQPQLRYITPGHTAALLPIFAHGPSAQRFGGLIRNDEVGRNLIALVRRGGGT